MTLGIRPDWWKLEPQASAAAWDAIGRVIDKNDPWCRGVVLLGLEAPQDELEAAFAATANAQVVKGFAVGRTIFAEPAEKWLAGQISDEAAVSDMARPLRKTHQGVACRAWPQGGIRVAGRETMTKTIRLTMAQALTRFMARQMTEIDGEKLPFFGGVWAIFGHGNVAGMGEALYQVRDELPTFRAHNEQAMAHAAIAYAKAHFRRRVMAATTSIGPGATNLVTAAALAHVNRLPLLLAAGRRLRQPRPRPRAAAGRGVSATARFRPMTHSARCRAISTALPGPSRSFPHLPAPCRY